MACVLGPIMTVLYRYTQSDTVLYMYILHQALKSKFNPLPSYNIPSFNPLILNSPYTQSKATAVVQMFHAHPDRSQWTKFKTGVACFVKDNIKKSYYIRLIDLAVSRVHFKYLYVGDLHLVICILK